MISKEQLERLYGDKGEACFTYLNNKHRGGVSNSKGNTFENQFAVYKIATIFNESADEQTTLFSSQVLCFIDDLVIEREDKNEVEYYQLKNVQSLSWLDNPHPLKDDFRMQHEVCSANGITAALQLVVSRKELEQLLIVNMPDEVKGFAMVMHFQHATSINNLVRENSEVWEALRQMCAFSNPATDKLDTLGNIILGAWAGVNQQRVSLREILDKCMRQNPHYIRGLENRLSGRLDNILSSIKGFSYEVEGGYINWKYNDTDSGSVSYRIGSVEFEAWENHLFNSEPLNSFEDIESFLI